MEKSLLNIGFGNTVVAERVVGIVAPNSAPMKRLKDEAREDKRLVDATHGRRTRSIIIMDRTISFCRPFRLKRFRSASPRSRKPLSVHPRVCLSDDAPYFRTDTCQVFR